MAETEPKKNIKKLEMRARLPRILGILAAAGLGAIVFIIVLGFYFNFGKEDFRMRGARDLKLSKDVIADIQGYERRETEGDKMKFFIRADRSQTFSDNHQEMDNIYLEVFDDSGEKSDIIRADQAIYIPDKNSSKLFTVFLAGDVKVDSRDGLKVETDQLTYKKETEVAEAEEYIEFSRENISGHSVGAIVNVGEKTLELLREVEIFSNAAEGDQLSSQKIQTARIGADHGFFDQKAGKIEFAGNVRVHVTPEENAGEFSQPADIEAERASAFFTDQELNRVELNGKVFVYLKPTGSKPNWTKTRADHATAHINKELKRLEMLDHVDIETTANQARPTRIKTNYALFEKDADRFELKNGVEITTVEDQKPTRITSATAIYEQAKGNIYLTGDARIDQGDDQIKGDNLTAYLVGDNKLKAANARGNAYLKQVTPERTTEISAPELNAVFDDGQLLQSANSRGDSRAVLVPAKKDSYSRVTLTAPTSIRLNFQKGLIQKMETQGRTTIALNVPDNNPDASNKKLTADSVTTQFDSNGKDLVRAQAVGNAELFIDPLRSSPQNYQTAIYAPRFDCDFFEGNNARNCSASTNVRAVRTPTVAGQNRGKQNVTSATMNAFFDRGTNDLEKLEAEGNVKFSELDRQGNAEKMSFTQADEVVRLRGGEPTVWDSRARAKASEIDWDTRNEKSFLRGQVATTYYSQKSTGGATPFGNAKSPVFLTSNEAQFDHRAEIGVYSGNARAWQENNYVRAEKLVVQQKEGKLYGEGTVQSLLYDAKKRGSQSEKTVPVYAAGDKVYYVRSDNFLRYEGNVDIRQGSDRILAGRADIYLKEDNELSQTIVEQNVVITQPNRRASGEYAKYNASDESVILRGNPARIQDQENGSSEGAQFTIFMRDNRFVSESKGNDSNTGRIRSVYKVKNQPE
ncbi:MAG: LPS export ABC transporter periplasmic protein LptC [Pyrinomonadaceae bacterium]